MAGTSDPVDGEVKVEVEVPAFPSFGSVALEAAASPATPAAAELRPSLRAHVFASTKGGTGKTTVLYQAATQYASDHPGEQVLVVDCSYAGDISALLSGGARVEQAAQKFRDGANAAELFKHLLAMVDDGELAETLSALKVSSSASKGAGPPTLVSQFGVPVRELNPEIALDNLFLVRGGTTGHQPCRFLFGADDALPPDDMRRLAAVLRRELAALPGVWRVFFDSDPIGNLETNISMRVMICAADDMVLFTEAGAADLLRAHGFLGVLALQQAAEAKASSPCAGVSVVCFNKVLPDPAHGAALWAPLCCAVRPHMRAARKVIESYANNIADFAVSGKVALRRLFQVSASPHALGVSKGDFIARTFMVMQDFRRPGVCSADVGVPFCCLEPAREYRGLYDAYRVGGAQLAKLIANVQELNTRLK